MRERRPRETVASLHARCRSSRNRCVGAPSSDMVVGRIAGSQRCAPDTAGDLPRGRIAPTRETGETMTTPRSGYGILAAAALVALAVACGKDPVSRPADDGALRPSVDAASSDETGGGRQIAILDDCDPTDPAWAPTGGCLSKRGNVTNAEFNALLTSPLSL